MDIDEFRRQLREDFELNRRAFEGEYKDELNELLGLSRDEIDLITPDGTDLAIYDQLIVIVKRASATNLAQAELKQRIEELGAIALEIANRVGPLAAKIGLPIA